MGTKTTRRVGGQGRSAEDREQAAPVVLKKRKTASVLKAGRKPQGKADDLGGTDPTYLTLIRRLPLRPIRNDAALHAAAEVVDELTDRDDLSPAEFDYLDVLGDLIEKYEDEHVKMPHVAMAQCFRSLMEEKGVRPANVVRGSGDQQNRLIARPERQTEADSGTSWCALHVFRCEPVVVPGPGLIRIGPVPPVRS